MNKKFVASLVFLALVGSGLSFSSAFAKENDNKNRAEHAREARATGSTLEIHIFDDGKVLVRGAKVASIASSSFTAVTAWGSPSLNWTAMTDANTHFVRKSGGASSLSEISVGDFVSFNGSLDSASTGLVVKATSVKNWSVWKKHASFYGTVSSVSSSSMNFVLAAENNINLTVIVSASTTIKKGDSTGVFADILVGSKVTAQGLLNTQTNVLEAEKVKVHLSGAVRTTLEGKIKTLPGATAPTTMMITAGRIDYTVNISVDTSVLNALWLRLPLASMRVCDGIRVYGTVNANATVDATV